MNQYIHDEHNNLWYVLSGDYYVPLAIICDEKRPIGRFGRLHREYLQENYPVIFEVLILTGKLWSYLADINAQAQSRIEIIIQQFCVKEHVTEELKHKDAMLWVQEMNSIRQRAEEIVLHELIYTFESES